MLDDYMLCRPCVITMVALVGRSAQLLFVSCRRGQGFAPRIEAQINTVNSTHRMD